MKRLKGQERWLQTFWGLCGVLHSVGSCVCFQGSMGRGYPPADFLVPFCTLFLNPQVWSCLPSSRSELVWFPFPFLPIYPVPSLLPWFFSASKAEDIVEFMLLCRKPLWQPCWNPEVTKAQTLPMSVKQQFCLLRVCTEIKMLPFSGEICLSATVYREGEGLYLRESDAERFMWKFLKLGWEWEYQRWKKDPCYQSNGL